MMMSSGEAVTTFSRGHFNRSVGMALMLFTLETNRVVRYGRNPHSLPTATGVTVTGSSTAMCLLAGGAITRVATGLPRLRDDCRK